MVRIYKFVRIYVKFRYIYMFIRTQMQIQMVHVKTGHVQDTPASSNAEYFYCTNGDAVNEARMAIKWQFLSPICTHMCISFPTNHANDIVVKQHISYAVTSG